MQWILESNLRETSGRWRLHNLKVHRNLSAITYIKHRPVAFSNKCWRRFNGRLRTLDDLGAARFPTNAGAGLTGGSGLLMILEPPVFQQMLAQV